MEKLRNGVTVWRLPPAEGSGLVCVKLVVDVGWNVERRHEYGICHFLEHLFAKYSSSTRPLANENELVISNLGIDGNAYTTAHETGYWLSGSSEDLDTIVGYMVDCLVSFRVDESVFEKERKAVINELHALTGDKWLKFEEKVHSLLYRGTGDYAKRTLAKEIRAVKRLTVGQVQAFYRDWYVPERCSLVLSGDVHGWTPPPSLTSQWGGSRSVLPPPPLVSTAAARTTLHVYSSKSSTTLIKVYFPFRYQKTVETSMHQKMLLRLLCGSGLTSPMYQRLRGLCYYVHASLERCPEKDRYFCCVQTETVEHDKAHEVTRLIHESIGTLFPLEPLLLERERKRRLLDVREAKLSATPTSAVAFYSNYLSTGEVPPFDQLEEVVHSATAADLRVQHRLIFTSAPCVLTVCTPAKTKSAVSSMPSWGFPPVTFESSGGQKRKKVRRKPSRKQKKKNAPPVDQDNTSKSDKGKRQRRRWSIHDILKAPSP